MKSKLLFIVCFLIYQGVNGQVLSMRLGQMFYHSKTITPVLGQIKQIDNRTYLSLHYNDFLPNHRVELGAALSFYSGWTRFNVDTDFWRGNGGSSSNISRLAVLGGYSFLKSNRRFKIVPHIRIIFERAKSTAGFSQSAYIDSRVDDNYEGPISLLPLNSFQVLPALGLDLDWNFWWRLHFVYSTYYAWGHKPFQKYYFEYTYQGVPQPTAEWHSDGTGWFLSVGLGMRVWGYQKVKELRSAKRKQQQKKKKKRRF